MYKLNVPVEIKVFIFVHKTWKSSQLVTIDDFLCEYTRSSLIFPDNMKIAMATIHNGDVNFPSSCQPSTQST